MADIVIAEMMDEAAVASLREGYDVLYEPKLCDDANALAAALAPTRGLVVRNRTQVRDAVLAAAPNLKVVGRLGVGLDNIDVAACRARGIAVCPATGANAIAVAEYVITAMLMLLRNAFRESDRVIAGAWPRNELIGHEADGRCMGLIGYGATAQALGARARALGLSVAAYDPFLKDEIDADPTVSWSDLRALVQAADVISLHVPLTEQTRYLLSSDNIAAMRPRAIIINTARGGVVEESALIEALRAGRLGGAALDVFEDEPLSDATGAKFKGVPNLLLTPHIAGVTKESNINVSAVTARNVRRVLEGTA